MLTEKTLYQVEVTEEDNIQVRARAYIYKDGEVLTHTNHRHVIVPGQDYSKEPKKVRKACEAVHLPHVVAKYQAKQAFFAAKHAEKPDELVIQEAKKAFRKAEKEYDLEEA